MPLPKKITDAMRSHPAFYQAVWKACAEIPAGEVRTLSLIHI